MLEVKSVYKKFKSRIVLQEVSFTIHKGVVGLLGPNGAGKTTLLRLLATYYNLEQGSIHLNGVEWTSNTEEVRQKIGYLPQHIGVFPSLKVSEYLEYIGVLRGMSMSQLSLHIPRSLREVNLENVANERIRTLSGGMKQRLGIAQAILHEPELLLVDEPTVGLDPEERIRFRNLIRKLGKERLVILSTHITEDISMTCDQVLLMDKGKVELYNSSQDVTEIASNQVWSLETDHVTFSKLRNQAAGIITQFIEKDPETVLLRIISAHQPHSNANLVTPVLEEGYVVWLHRN